MADLGPHIDAEFVAGLIAEKAAPVESWKELLAWVGSQHGHEGESWSEIAAVDISPDMDTVAAWFMVSLKEILEQDEAVGLLWVSLGECPEIFCVSGGSLADKATQKAARLTGQAEEFDFDEACELAEDEFYCRKCYKVGELAASFWKHFPMCDSAKGSPFDMMGGRVLWHAFATLAIAHALRSNEAAVRQIVGDRKSVALLTHVEETAYGLGVIVDGIWTPPQG
jgi:hypothetical protein